MKHDDRFPMAAEWLTDEDGMLVESVARWAEREVVSLRSKHREDFEALHAPALHVLMEQVGLAYLIWPEDGDQEASAITWAATMEQVGRADVGLGVLLANTVALQRCIPIAEKPRYGVRGDIAALVLPGYGNGAGEPGPGWLHGLTPQVEAAANMANSGGFTLSGKDVRPQVHGARASCFGVVVALDGEPALFAMPASAAGLSVGEPFLKTGLHASCNADLTLRSVSVGEPLWKGAADWNRLQAWTLMGCAAAASGGLLSLHAILDDWCESRVIKGRGQRFKDNPLVGALLGEVGGTIATGRVLLYQLARHLDTCDSGRDVDAATAVALTRTVLRGAMDALDRSMELMASAGYATEWNLERYWRDTKTLATYLHLETAGQMVLAKHCFGCAEL